MGKSHSHTTPKNIIASILEIVVQISEYFLKYERLSAFFLFTNCFFSCFYFK